MTHSWIFRCHENDCLSASANMLFRTDSRDPSLPVLLVIFNLSKIYLKQVRVIGEFVGGLWVSSYQVTVIWSTAPSWFLSRQGDTRSTVQQDSNRSRVSFLRHMWCCPEQEPPNHVRNNGFQKGNQHRWCISLLHLTSSDHSAMSGSYLGTSTCNLKEDNGKRHVSSISGLSTITKPFDWKL